jgi:ATP-binding cassette subfamily F protein 3
MSIMTISNLSKYYGAQRVLEGVSFAIARGEKIGLVGRNGTGKTTLLRILAGEEEADGGAIALASGTRVGYLEQNLTFEPATPLLGQIEDVFRPLLEMEDEVRRLEHEMASAGATGPAFERVFARYEKLVADFEARGGYTFRQRARQTLVGLGFLSSELELPFSALSGGQKVRAALARLLLSEPELLLLDEPTNHLDVDATEWLEGYLKTFSGAVLAVSHDRYFMDAVMTRIVALDGGEAQSYPGNYTAFILQREQLRHDADVVYSRQVKEAAKLKYFIQRYQAGQRHRQADGRSKALAKLESSMRRPRATGRNMRLSFTLDEVGGREVFRLFDLGKGYESKTLFAHLTATIFRGERVALVGPNGSGKTTLIRLLLGLEEPDHGRVEWGGGILIGYFSQDLDELDDGRTVLDEMLETQDLLPAEARNYLGRFLFRGDDAFKIIGDLSGGERNRLILAKLMLSGANVLVLDEPTNHLDTESRAALEQALLEFPGTIVVTSHDRYFLDRLATCVFELGDDGVRRFQGNYTALRLERERARVAATAAGAASGAAAAPNLPAGGRAERRATAAGSVGKKPTRPARRRPDQQPSLEMHIQRLELSKKRLEARLADPETYRTGQGRSVTEEYHHLLAELEEAYRRWEQELVPDA